MLMKGNHGLVDFIFNYLLVYSDLKFVRNWAGLKKTAELPVARVAD